jgi:hypothetical protein
MTYDEVEVGQRVTLPGGRTVTGRERPREAGVVVAAEVLDGPVGPREVVYVNTDKRGRRLCAPSVLELIA